MAATTMRGPAILALAQAVELAQAVVVAQVVAQAQQLWTVGTDDRIVSRVAGTDAVKMKRMIVLRAQF